MGTWIARGLAIASVAVATLVMGAILGAAAIQTVNPGNGTTTPGGVVVATVSMNSASSCLYATTVDPSITVGFSPPCGGGGAWTSTMTIHTTPQTLPIVHLVTITERSGPLALLTDLAVYTLTVSAPQATTTTTTTSPASTTTTLPQGTTTTTTPGSTTTTTPGSTTTTQPDDGTTTTQPQTTTTTRPGSTTTTTPGSTTTTTSEVAGTEPGQGEGGSPVAEPIALTRSLLGHFHPGPPRTIAAIVLSPLAVLEVLVRTITSSLGALAIPLALLTALGLWLLARRRAAERTSA